MAEKKMTYVAAMRDFFYRKDVDTLQNFMVELKALTPADKAEFKVMLGTVGYDITE